MRIAPKLPAAAYKTYAITSPVATHFRPASCREVGCAAWQKGWVTRVPWGSDLADYVLGGTHGRTYREITAHGEAERSFMFDPEQPCFRESQHRVSLERPAIYTVRDGDWRENPTGRSRTHVRPEDWVDDFANHQQHIADRVSRG